MKVVNHIEDMQKISNQLRRANLKIGLVPTMGFFHNAHLSLMKIAKQNSDVVIVSNFVNPLQFGPKEDLKTYPKDLSRDMKLAESVGVDYMFIPPDEEMYPSDYSTFVEVTQLDKYLCGKSRPSHFKGVVTVCTKLFNICKPDVVVFGQKDAQQAFIIRRLLRDLNYDCQMIIAPIVRESDGLAMSSRNIYLKSGNRKKASALYKSLQLAKRLIEVDGVRDSITVIDSITSFLNNELADLNPPVVIDYISIVDTNRLKPVDKLQSDVLIALAVKIGNARLIDNIILKISD